MKTQITQEQYRQYANALRVVSLKSQEEARRVLGELSGADPSDLRNAALVIVPAIVEKYGALAAQVSSEFFGYSREQSQVKKKNNVGLSDADARKKAVSGSVRWAAGDLFDE